MAAIREEIAAEEEKLRLCKASVGEFHQKMRSHYAEEIRTLARLAEGIPLPEKQPVPQPEPEPEPEPVPQILFEDEVNEPEPEPAPPASEFDRVYGNMNYVKEVKQASLHKKQ
jgi:hypothetical protein